MDNELDYNSIDSASVESSNAKCKNCGSNVTFNPKTQNLKCPQCDSEFEFDKVNVRIKHDIHMTNEDRLGHDRWAKEMRVVKCDTCGAKITINGLEITTACPYCGSDYVQEVETLAGLKPDVVIPFAFDEDEAAERFAKGLKKKFFVPSVLKKKLPASKVHGIYAPTFTFDADTTSKYQGVLSKTTTYTDSKGNTRTSTKRFPISGTKAMSHRDYMIETSSKLTSKQINSLMPFDLGKTFKYSNDFVRGYSLEHYEDDLKTCYADARKGMEQTVKAAILRQYDYTNVDSFHMDTSYSNELYAYQIVPIYIFEFDFKKKHYMTYMNGQTGKVGTGYPKSALKISLLAGLAVLVVILIIVLIMMQ